MENEQIFPETRDNFTSQVSCKIHGKHTFMITVRYILIAIDTRYISRNSVDGKLVFKINVVQWAN